MNAGKECKRSYLKPSVDLNRLKTKKSSKKERRGNSQWRGRGDGRNELGS
jgi:hypothetical protein